MGELRTALACGAVVGMLLVASEPLRAAEADATDWVEATSLTLEGKPFMDTKPTYGRVPVRYKERVTQGVWNTGTNAAGVGVRFKSDTTTFTVQWDNSAPMNHMAYTGSGGVDLYRKDGGKWRYCSTGIPRGTDTSATLRADGPVTPDTEFLLCLPLYSRVDKVRLAAKGSGKLTPVDTSNEPLPIVFYGTSITQGGCASRAGMSHPGILRRMLDWPVVNLGFSGSGKCEPVMAELLAEIEASMYIIETLPNMNMDLVKERMEPFIRDLRKRRPDTPILLVDNPNAPATEERDREFKRIFEKLTAEGMSAIHFLEVDISEGYGENGTVDGVHPTDLGFFWMAEKYQPAISRLLPRRSKTAE